MSLRPASLRGLQQNAIGAMRIAAPFPADISPLVPEMAQWAPRERSLIALSVLEPIPDILPEEYQSTKDLLIASGLTDLVRQIASHVARVNCVSSEMVETRGMVALRGPCFPSNGTPWRLVNFIR